MIDEFTRECIAIRIGRRFRSTDVIDVLSDLSILRGVLDADPPNTGSKFHAGSQSATRHLPPAVVNEESRRPGRLTFAPQGGDAARPPNGLALMGPGTALLSGWLGCPVQPTVIRMYPRTFRYAKYSEDRRRSPRARLRPACY